MKRLITTSLLISALTLSLSCAALRPSQDKPAEPAAVVKKDAEAKPDAAEKKAAKAPEKNEAAPDAAKKTAEAAKPDAKKPKGKPFAEVVKDFKKYEGLFTFYEDKDELKVYLEVKPEQFDKVYLCSTSRAAGEAHFTHPIAMLDSYPFYFKRLGPRIQLLRKNVGFRMDPSTAFHRALERDLSDSIVASAKVESAPHPESRGVLVDAASLFMHDIGRMTERQKDYRLDKENSYFSKISAFPKNTEVRVLLQYASSKSAHVPTLPDSRSFRHIYHYSLAEIPESSYQPRLADDRVGYFITQFQDYTTLLRDHPYVRYAERWDLQKAEPRFKLSPPKKPIVYWVENTVPVEYRAAVREGALLWNQAFEKIGFKGAIVVKQMPDDADWDPEDARYNVIRWMLLPGVGIAVGPSHANPFTGQIFSADVRVSSEWVRHAFREYTQGAEPQTHEAAEPEIAAGPPGSRCWRDRLCSYGNFKAEEAAFGWNVMAARAGADGQPLVPPEEFIHDMLVDLVCHEVGHTLGLRHNFKGSSAYTLEQLADAEFTKENGISSSVMDYVPLNLAPKGKRQGQYYQTTVGLYDRWAIEYGYGEVDPASGESEQAMLKRVAAKSAAPLLAYGTDKDAGGIDPLCQRYDLSADPVAALEDRLAIARELWSGMEERFEEEGKSYHKLRTVFGRALGQYTRSVSYATDFIGGLHQYRNHVGDPNGKLPFAPTPAAKQRAALTYLTKNVFGVDALKFKPELLNKLAPSHFWTFDGDPYETSMDYPLHAYVARMHDSALGSLFNPTRMHRLVDLELRYAANEEKFTLTELFDGVNEAVWTELEAPANVGSFRRVLQRKHAKTMIDLMLAPPSGAPEDARTLARAVVKNIATNIDKALKANARLDRITRAHLEELRELIGAALEARAQRGLQ